MKPPSSVQMVVHSRVMGLTQRMNDYPMNNNTLKNHEQITLNKDDDIGGSQIPVM